MLSEETQEVFRKTGIDIQSYLLLKEGIKPVIRVGLNQSMLETAKKTAEKLGLEMMIKEFTELYGGKLPKKTINAYYSLDKNLCKEALDSEINGERKKFGLLLGYPECCVDNFIKNLGVDFILLSLKNTKTRPSFYCNNLFVFDSKVGKEIKVYMNNLDLFDNLDVKFLFLIRHVPCSFDCKHSIKIGKATLKLLKNNSPDLVERIVNSLRRPVLYWNYFEWIILNGHQKDDTIRYDEVLNYESLISSETKKMIENGNSIKIGDGEISVFSNNKKIEEIPRNCGIPVCINFQ